MFRIVLFSLYFLNILVYFKELQWFLPVPSNSSPILIKYLHQSNVAAPDHLHLILETVELVSNIVTMNPLLVGTDIKDPKAPLSMTDLATLLQNQCDLKIKQNNFIERDLTTDKIRLIHEHFNDRLNIVNEVVEKLTSTNEAKVSEINMKIETISSYQEQLIHNLKLGLQDVLLLI